MLHCKRFFFYIAKFFLTLKWGFTYSDMLKKKMYNASTGLNGSLWHSHWEVQCPLLSFNQEGSGWTNCIARNATQKFSLLCYIQCKGRQCVKQCLSFYLNIKACDLQNNSFLLLCAPCIVILSLLCAWWIPKDFLF